MSRANYRFRDHTLTPDKEPDAEPLTYTFQCAVCDTNGPTDTEPDTASHWTFRHLKEHPEHFTYRSLVTLPYRITPGAWQ